MKVTDEMVEAGARAICKVRYGDWDQVEQFDRDLATEDAGVALVAALRVAPTSRAEDERA